MTTPSWDLSIAYRDLNDAKIEQDIELIQQCIELLYLHVEKRHIILAMQNAIQTSEAAGTLLSTINTFANCHASVDATHTEAKALLGRVAKLNSEMSQAFSPYDICADAGLVPCAELGIKHTLRCASADPIADINIIDIKIK